MAIAKKSEATLDRDILKRCFERNPHGAGFAIAKEGKLTVEKGYFNFDEFWDNFNAIQKDVPAIVHFRYASAGNINPKNCHPWLIDKNHAMIHNGTLWSFVCDNSELSDSGLYTKLVLRPLFKSNRLFWKTKYGRYLLTEPLGTRSKMIILSNKGEFTIFNEEFGEWSNEEEKDVWYSNDGFKEESEYCGTTYPRQLTLNLQIEEIDEEGDESEQADEEGEADECPFNMLT